WATAGLVRARRTEGAQSSLRSTVRPVMTRRRWLIALLGTLGALAFPGEGSALLGYSYVSLPPTGPSPSVLTIHVVNAGVMFQNTDTVTHSIAFANSSCSGDVAPSGSLLCSNIPYHVGDYAYTVDGTTQ